MQLIKVTNVKQFMNKLLIENAFDAFLISEAVVKTFNTFIIDGHINADYYSSEELAELEAEAEASGRIFSSALSRWGKIKPHVLALIKGNKTPSGFKMSFYLSGENTLKLLSSLDTSITANDIDALSLIVKYENDELTLTSSSSLKIFSLDKSLEHHWDNMIVKFLNSHNVEFNIM